MNNNLLNLIAELRLVVGFLGEKSQFNWWSSEFFSPASQVFLMPVFPRTVFLSQYHAVCEAALLVHDDHIGIGINYHLYRLPDSIERSVAKVIHDSVLKEHIKANIENIDVALNRLKDFSTTQIRKAEGPIIVGDFSDAELDQLLRTSSTHYLKSFSENYKCFPYMREAEC